MAHFGPGTKEPTSSAQVAVAHPHGTRALHCLAFGIAFLLCAEVGRFLSWHAGAPGLLWLPAGLWLWSTLVEKPSTWGWFALAAATAIAVFVWHHSLDPAVAVGVYAGTGIAAITGAGLLRAAAIPAGILSSLRGLVLFCLAAPLAGAALGATVQVQLTTSLAFGPWFAAWSRLAAGMLLVTPFLFAWVTPAPGPEWRRPSALWVETCLLLCGFGLVSWFTFQAGAGSAPAQRSRIFLFALWAGLRLGLPGACLVLVAEPWVLAMTVGGRMGPGFEPFLAISALLALFPAMILEEQHRRVAELRALAGLCSRAERREHHRARILEMISSDAPLAGILDYVARSMEEENPRALCSILILGPCRQRLMHGAGPSLPAFYNEAINGLAIGDGVGSCGTAAFQGRPVVVEDVACHPYWAPFRDLAERAGVRACWSQPVKSADGEVLGTFAIYHREPRVPEPPEVEAIEIAAGYVSLAVEHTRARETLRENQARLLMTLDMARLGHWEYDVTERRYSLDATFYRLLGTSSDEQGGRFLSQEEYARRFLSPADAARVEEELAAAAASPDTNALRSFVHEVRRTDGTRGQLAVRLAVMQGDPDRAVRILGISQDVSEQREAEQTRARLEEQLRQARSLEALGTLAGGTAHEFNNILGIILGHVELADILMGPPHAASADLAGAARAVHRGRQIVEQLLTFSRQRTQPRELVDLGPLATEAAENLRRIMPPGIALILEVPPDIAPIKANATQVHQAIHNLGRNAIQAMRPHGGTIRIGLSALTLAPGTVLPRTELPPGPYVRLTVSDSGPGMDPATLARVFEPFFTTKAPGEGSGLGLPVVHGIMQSHGGAVLVDSTPGQGTRCQLWFPSLPGESLSPAGPDVQEAPPAGHGEHILVVDDEPSLVSVLTKYLRRQGYRVTAAASAEEALQLAGEQATEIDLAVTDLTMPGMNGAQLARALVERRPGLPVILATGGGAGTAPSCEAIPDVSAILLKPFSTETLARTVHQALQLAPGRRTPDSQPQP